MARHGKERQLGRVWIAPFDVHFSPLNVVHPDLRFVRLDRLAIAETRSIAGPPDLVIDILSPGTYCHDQVIKPEYWIVDTRARAAGMSEWVGERYQTIPHDADGRPRSRVLPDLLLYEPALFLAG